MSDFSVEYHGSLVVLQPLTAEANEWLAEHCPPDEEHMYWAGGLVAEPRYVDDLIEGMNEDGLTVDTTF